MLDYLNLNEVIIFYIFLLNKKLHKSSKKNVAYRIEAQKLFSPPPPKEGLLAIFKKKNNKVRKKEEKSMKQETKNLLTYADSSTDTF